MNFDNIEITYKILQYNKAQLIKKLLIKNKNNIIESINEKKTNNEEFFQIEKYFNKKTLIFFSPKIELPLSSYCSYFPIKNNFKKFQSEDNDYFCYPYLGDENLNNIKENFDEEEINKLLKADYFFDFIFSMYMEKKSIKEFDQKILIENFTNFIIKEYDQDKSDSTLTLEKMIFHYEKIFFSIYKSIKATDKIDEFSINKIYKLSFCNICMIYLCSIHGLKPNKMAYYIGKNRKNLNPSNFLKLQNEIKKYRLIPKLDLNKSIWDSMKNTLYFNFWKIKPPCEKSCYLNNNWKFYDSFELVNFKVTDKIAAKIKLGISIFSFDPCMIRNYLHLLNNKHYKCEEVFLFLVDESKKFNINNNEFNSEMYQKLSKSETREKRKKIIKTDVQYQPCFHNFDSSMPLFEKEPKNCSSDNCSCFKAHGFCDSFCGCDKKTCPLMRKGCLCQGSCIQNSCLCFIKDMECDPEICLSCCKKCKNNSFLNKKQKRTIIGQSLVCNGYGLFNVTKIHKNEFIIPYYGEIIKDKEAIFRDTLNIIDKFMYTFDLMPGTTIDSKFMGNKSRFINHSKLFPNCYGKNIYSNGHHYIGFYATEDILPGSELLFDYTGNENNLILEDNFSWINNEKKINPNKQNCEKEKKYKTYNKKRKNSFTFNKNFEIEIPIIYESPKILKKTSKFNEMKISKTPEFVSTESQSIISSAQSIYNLLENFI